MRANDTRLQSLINTPNRYIIPIFQRYYSWNKENWQTLWEDIESLVDPEGGKQSHFMGSLVFVPIPDPADTVFQVIDGQQRLMTFSLLLSALRYLAHEREMVQMKEEIYQHFLVHPFKSGQKHYRVFPRQRDRDQYMAAINSPTLDIDGNIGEALRFFAKRAGEMAETPEALEQLFTVIKSQLKFVNIIIEDENPYQIFKSLNSTGVDLSEADLIRNFVFMHVEVEAQDYFDDTYWHPLEQHFLISSGKNKGKLNNTLITRFFRDFLMMERQRYVPRNAVFTIFEERYEREDFGPVALAEHLIENAKLYDIIRGVSGHWSPEVNASLAKLGKLKSRTTWPLLLALLHKNASGWMTSEELSEAIELLSGFILRRYAANESSRGYGYTFANACRVLKDEPLTNLRRYLQEKGFPSDDHFREAFIRFPWYIRDYARVVLQGLERSYQHKEPADLSQSDVEHIMPQTLTPAWRAALGPETERIHEQWLHTIGNLTLSGYNPPMSNKPFSEKLPFYEDSNIRLNRELARWYDEWGEAEIEVRGRELADRALEIWIGPEE